MPSIHQRPVPSFRRACEPVQHRTKRPHGEHYPTIELHARLFPHTPTHLG